MFANPSLRQSASSTVGSVSACSDRREINEAKVQGILSYLDEVQQTNSRPSQQHQYSGGISGMGLAQLQLEQQQQQSLLLAQHHSSVSQVAGVAPSPPPPATTSGGNSHQDPAAPMRHQPTDLGQYLLPLSPGRTGEPVQEGDLQPSTHTVYTDPMLSQPHQQQYTTSLQPHYAASHYTNVSALTGTTSHAQQHQPQHQQHHHLGSTSAASLSVVDSNVPSVYNGIKGKMQALKAEAESNAKENEKLKFELSQAKINSQVELKKALDQQETEFDKKRTQLQQTVDNHLKHMKTLLADKEELTARVKELARQNEDYKTKRETEIDRLERKHTKAFSEAKSRWEAVERSKREKWEEERTKKLKSTITATMEPEIQRMISRHKTELRTLEEQKEEQLKAKQTQLDKKEQELTLCKERHSQEIEMVLAREREASRLRLSEEADRSQRSTDHLKTVSQEKVDAAHREVDSLRAQLKKLEEQLLESKVREREMEHATQQKVLLQVEQIRQAKENEILALKEELMGRRAEWTQEYEKNQSEYLKQREAELQKQCENQRDLEIQKVMSEFEKELVEESTQHKAAEKKNREVQNSLQREADRLKSEHVLLSEQREKTMDLLKEKHTESEHLKEEISHLRQELRTAVDQRESEFTRRIKELDQQWEAKLRAVQRQNDTSGEDLRGQLHRKDAEILQIRTDADTAMRSLEQQQHLELSAINDRILVVVSQKDQTIKQLSDDNQRLQVEVGKVRSEMTQLLQA